jgi:hypothetical protein
MMVHFHDAASQPATNYRDHSAPRGFRQCRNAPHSLITCCDCRKQHRAVNMRVKAFYDGAYFFCADRDACRKARRRKRRGR